MLCGACSEEHIAPLPARCYRCKSATPDSRVCAKCRRTSRLKHVWVCTNYDQLAKQLIHDFKFTRKQAAAEPIARLMDDTLPFLPPKFVVMYVPTVTSRMRTRGYDQAKLLAQAVATHRSLRMVSGLARHGQARQVGATRQQRLTQLDTAFRVSKPDDIRGASVLLVDDLVTTGATLEAVAKCLRQAGAGPVSAVVFAQK